MNNLHAIDVAIIGVYLVVVVVSGFILTRRASQNIESYFLGGRNIPWYLLGISNASGMFDISGTMWMVMLLFVYGLKSLWMPWVWPSFNQVFMMVFLAAWLRRSGALTGAEWLRTRFGKGDSLELAHLSVVIFALVTVVAFISYAFIGVGKFAAGILPWDLAPNTYATIILSLTAAYVTLGGMYSVVLTDILQFFLLTVASLFVAGIAIYNTTGEQLAAATPEGWGNLWFGWRLQLDWGGHVPSVTKVVQESGYEIFMPFLAMAFCKGVLASIAGPTPGYDMQRILAARNDREASLMSAIVSPVLYLPRYFMIAGIAALALVYYSSELATQDTPDFESILPYVVQNYLPVGLVGILLAGLLAAFMSTFDSTVNAGAAYLVNDVYKRYLQPQATPRQLVKASYLASVAIVLVGIVVGWRGNTIDAMLQWITAGLYGGYVAPNVLKWVWWRLNGAGYCAGMVTGIALSLLATQTGPALDWLVATSPELTGIVGDVRPFTSVLYLFPLLLLGSGLASVIVSLATPEGDRELLKSFYRQVRPWGWWGPIREDLARESSPLVVTSHFSKDMFNCMIGIAWQITLCGLPVYIVFRNGSAAVACGLALLVTTVLLKLFWYDSLRE